MASPNVTGTPESRTDRPRRLYEEHLRAGFRERLRNTVLSGVDVTVLDADVAGVVAAWLQDGGRSDPAQRAVARACLQDLDQLLPELTDTHQRRCVGRLREPAALLAEAGG